MQLHQRQHCPREGANMKCPHCPYWVKYRKTLNSHLRFHPQASGAAIPGSSSPHGTNEQEPEFEGREDNEAGFEELSSSNLTSPNRKYQCEACAFRTDNKSHFLYHKQFHRPNKNAPFKCTHCTYWSFFKNIMNKHVRTHAEPTTTEPTTTTTETTSDAEVVVESNPPYEMREMNGKLVKMFKCRQCPMMNRRRTSVKAHESQHSSVRSMKFSCSFCNYQSNHQGVITSHMRLHGDSDVSITDILNESLRYPPEPLEGAAGSTSPRSKELVRARAKQRVTYICRLCPAVFKSKHDYQVHNSFHGASYPHSCTHCNYHAKHKPHLHRHMTVHSSEYLEKRENSIRNTIQKDSSDSALSQLLTTPAAPSKDTSEKETTRFDIDNPDALLKERKNTMVYSKNQGTGKNAKMKYRCKACPMAFHVLSEKEFHRQLHRSGAEHSCPKCTYAVNKPDILAIHVKLHTKSLPASQTNTNEPEPPPSDISASSNEKTVLKIVSCSFCPAVFTKGDRLDKHLALHGAKNKYTCSECNYSVRFMANLYKHKKVHQSDYNPKILKDRKLVKETVSEPSPAPTPAKTSPVKNVSAKSHPKEPKEKHIFQCSHCPYSNARRDTVINHMNRHGTTNSIAVCPYCDYATSTASYLKDHIKLHFQPKSFIKVRAYMKYEQLEIWTCNGSKGMIFKDRGEDNKLRFFPEVIEEEPETDEENESEAESRRDSVEERNLIQNAIQEGRKLEIVLTRTDTIPKKLSVENDRVKCDAALLQPDKVEEGSSSDVLEDASIMESKEEEEEEEIMQTDNIVETEVDDIPTEEDAGSLILSSFDHDSATEDRDVDDMASARRADTPTEVLSDIMCEIDSNEKRERLELEKISSSGLECPSSGVTQLSEEVMDTKEQLDGEAEVAVEDNEDDGISDVSMAEEPSLTNNDGDTGAQVRDDTELEKEETDACAVDDVDTQELLDEDETESDQIKEQDLAVQEQDPPS